MTDTPPQPSEPEPLSQSDIEAVRSYWSNESVTDYRRRLLATIDFLRLRAERAERIAKMHHYAAETDLIRDGWDHPITRCGCGTYECEHLAALTSSEGEQ